MTLPIRRHHGQKVFLHPATLLIALLASAYVFSNEKELIGDGVSVDSHSKNTSMASLLMQKFSVFAAAMLAATWIENQADSVVKFFENGPLFHSAHDEKGTQLAVTHDVAPLDGITQTAQNIDPGLHRADLSNQLANFAATSEENQGVTALKPSIGANSAHSPSDNNDANIAVLEHANDDHTSAASLGVFQSDGCNVVGLTNLPAISLGSIAAEVAAANQLSTTSAATTENLQNISSNNSIVATDAFHLAASEITAFSTQSVLLSTAPVSLSTALQQAFVQVGLGSNVLHNFTATPLDGVLIPVGDGAPVPGSSAYAESSINAAAGNAPTIPAPPTSPTVIDSQGLPSVNGEIVHSVEQFLKNTPSVEITLSGVNVVIIDTNVADAKSPQFGVVTWDMSDGSTLSIVGIIPPHTHAISA